MKTRFILPSVGVVSVVLVLIWIMGLFFWPQPTSDQAPAVEQIDTRKTSMYETPTEKLVTLSDGRKMVCLQASYGALWCTPALTDSK